LDCVLKNKSDVFILNSRHERMSHIEAFIEIKGVIYCLNADMCDQINSSLDSIIPFYIFLNWKALVFGGK
jgi:hypothetical protein